MAAGRAGAAQPRLQDQPTVRFLRDEVADQEMTRSEQKFHKSTIRGPAIEEARQKEAADAAVAALQLRLLQAQEQSARDTARVGEASHHEIATITREAERLRIEATVAAEAVATRAQEGEIRVKREFEHQIREAHTRAQLTVERLATQEAKVQALQAEVAAARNRPRSPSSASSRDHQGRDRPRRLHSGNQERRAQEDSSRDDQGRNRRTSGGTTGRSAGMGTTTASTPGIRRDDGLPGGHRDYSIPGTRLEAQPAGPVSASTMGRDNPLVPGGID
ncbi:unnamed protein product [Phytophthora fragariaefolia]|uniref:Unnamed protein product n=1 Tax=Phytophthora fragariaefolia TaxID=1490495 RepID=A0A9W6XW16_9STRA|nr:unnamed protein product [Phytophthora fragariaefolia]